MPKAAICPLQVVKESPLIHAHTRTYRHTYMHARTHMHVRTQEAERGVMRLETDHITEACELQVR